MLGSVRVCSLAVVVGLSVPLYQFPGRFPIFGEPFQGVIGCLLRARFRSTSCVSVRSCSSRSAYSSRWAVWLSARFSFRASRRGGDAAAGCCLLARARGLVGLLCWRCRPSRPVSLLARSLRGRGGWASGVSVLLGWSRRRCRCAAFRAYSGRRAVRLLAPLPVCAEAVG